jgi:ComEC/Rec2-related protein
MDFPDAALIAAFFAGFGGFAYLIWTDGKRAACFLAVAALALGCASRTEAERKWNLERHVFLEAAGSSARSVAATVSGRERMANGASYTLENISMRLPAQGREADKSDLTRLNMMYTGKDIFSPGDLLLIEGAKLDTATASEIFLKRERAAGTVLFPSRIIKYGNLCDGKNLSFNCMKYGLAGMLARTRESFEDRLHAVLPEPCASFAAGLLIGSRSQIPQDLKDAFARTGLSHIVAVSGYNITILVLAVSTLLGLFALPRVASFWMSAGFIVLFTLLTGASASVVRAALMGFLAVLAQKEARMYSARTAIAFAGAAMLFDNPMLLQYDMGFVLSFLATVGLLVLYPKLEELAHHWPAFGGAKEVALQSLSAQFFVLPVVIASFGSVSFVFLFANIMVLPFIPAAMMLSFIGAAAGYVSDIAGRIAAFPAYALMNFQIGTVKLISSVPFASVAIQSPAVKWTLASAAAACVALVLWLLRRNKETLFI